jgi:hypothetical protein
MDQDTGPPTAVMVTLVPPRVLSTTWVGETVSVPGATDVGAGVVGAGVVGAGLDGAADVGAPVVGPPDVGRVEPGDVELGPGPG